MIVLPYREIVKNEDTRRGEMHVLLHMVVAVSVVGRAIENIFSWIM
jgi:hypothetical protein